MKPVHARPASSQFLAWGGALLVVLLLTLAAAVLVAARAIELDGHSLGDDSVPGLTDADALRSDFSREFFLALQLAQGAGASDRARLKGRLAELDAQTSTFADEYRRSMQIDPATDSRNFVAVLTARDEFLQARSRVVGLADLGRLGEARAQVTQALRPRYGKLMDQCDNLVAYNSHNGSEIAARVLRRVARLRWAALSVMGLAVAAAVVMGITVVRRWRVERALGESEQRFSTAFRVSPYSMVISRRSDGTIIAANEAFLNVYGPGGQNVVGKTTVEIGVWKSAEQRERMMSRMDVEGRVDSFVKESIGIGSRRMVVLVSASPIVFGDENCVLSQEQDITVRVEAEEALARSAAQFRAVFEHSALGIALADSDGRLFRTNPALQKFFGYGAEELERRTYVELTHPDDVAGDQEKFRQLIAGEIESYRLEKRYLRSDRAVVWGRLTVSLVRDREGRFLFAVGLVEDITDRRKAEEALAESERARGQLQDQLIMAQKLEALGLLAGGVAHDFNNILAAILLYVDVMKSDLMISADMRGALEEVRVAARRAAGLTRQLLLFSRRAPAQRQTVDLNHIVGNLAKMLERLVGSQYTLACDRSFEPIWLHADPGMIEQVVMNLVVNARDAMPRGGRIAVRVEEAEVDPVTAGRHPDGKAGRFARLSVEDEGAGMNPATKARIFEPFFTTKESGKGTGLGLSTVMGIVQQHRGWIDVDSTEGRGSIFRIYLPIGAEPPEIVEPTPIGTRSLTGSETILLAEDDGAVRLATSRILRENGYKVIEAPNGVSARAILDRQGEKIDLLLTDVVMPGGITGDELARSLQGQADGPKVILMSAYNPRYEGALAETPPWNYLQKPFDTERLLQAVRGALDAE